MKYLKDTEAELNNVIIIMGDFNIRDSNWDLSYPHNLIHADNLLEITDLLNLEQSLPITLVLTRYIDNFNNFKSVFDLIFLRGYFKEFNSHLIFPNMRDLSDYMPLIINNTIQKKFIQEKKPFLYKGSNKERDFIIHLKLVFGNIDTTNIDGI